MKTSSRIQNSILNMGTSMVGQVLSIILRFVTRTVFIQVLGKPYLGINGLFTDILTMLSLTELGFDTAINFKLYKPLADNDQKRIRVLMKFYKRAYTVVGLAIIALGVCVIPLLRILIKDYDSLETLGINATLVFLLYLFQSASSYLFFAYRSAIVKADQKEYRLNIAGCGVTIATNLCQIIVLLTLQNFIIYTAVVVVFNIIQNYVFALIAKHYYPYVFIAEADNLSKDEVSDLFKDCGALFLYKVNGVVLKATDNMVLSSFIGLAIVGMYSNYLMVYTTIKTILQKFYDAVKASMGNLYAVSDMERRYKFFEVMNFITVVLYGTAGVGVAVIANELIECWIGSDYVIAQPLAVLMGVEILFVGLKNNLGQIRNVTGAFRQMWIRPLLGIIINIVVSVIMVNVCGIYGVLIGTITADCLTYFMVDPSVIYKYSFEGYCPVSCYYKKNIVYGFILMITALGDRWLCSIVLPNYGWLSVLVHVLICGLSVPLVFVIIYRTTDECKYILNLSNDLIKKIMKSR